MKAKEARAISNENKKPIESVYEIIKNIAVQGGQQCVMNDLDNNTVLEIIKQGYTVKNFVDPIGIESHIISW